MSSNPEETPKTEATKAEEGTETKSVSNPPSGAPKDGATIKIKPEPASKQLAESVKGLSKGGRQITPEEMNADLQKLLRRAKREEKAMEEHAFWKTQPVPKHGEQSDDNAPIEVKTLADVDPNGGRLPQGYEWCSVDLTDEKEREEVYQLLMNNYVEDDDAMFRFAYNKDFLLWALTPPGYEKDWHVGVRAKTGSRALAGFISGVPASIAVHSKKVPMVEINFLCVHKALRSKRLAPLLIKEVTRRVNLKDIWQAVYTAGIVIPKPVGRNRYYHRNLNPKKLYDIGFSRLPKHLTLAMAEKLYRLPNQPELKVRALEEKDCEVVCKELNKHQEQFKLVQVFDLAEFKHIFLPRKDVIYSYVVVDDKDKPISFFSFYNLPSTIINNRKYNLLRAAYSYYYYPGPYTQLELTRQALIMAKSEGFDVFNMLDLMNNSEQIITDLKFGKGDGTLQYYLYNWKCPELQSNEIGLVLV